MECFDYDFSQTKRRSQSLMQHFGALEVAMRQNDLAAEVRDYLKSHPNAAVVNLGCGLDQTAESCGNGSCRIYDFLAKLGDRAMRMQIVRIDFENWRGDI